MKINFTKTSHILFFAAVLPFTCYFIGWCFDKLFPNIPFWIESVSPLYAYLILYTIFEKYTWHWKIFSLLNIVTTPDLRGRWKGQQKSSYKENGNNVESDVVIEIKQSFSKIFIRSFYQKSLSESVVADFYELNDENYLFYTYDNDPSSSKSGTMERHRGTTKLQYFPKGKRLAGSYFNSIGNFGEIELTFQQTECVGRFNTQ